MDGLEPDFWGVGNVKLRLARLRGGIFILMETRTLIPVCSSTRLLKFRPFRGSSERSCSLRTPRRLPLDVFAYQAWALGISASGRKRPSASGRSRRPLPYLLLRWHVHVNFSNSNFARFFLVFSFTRRWSNRITIVQRRANS